MIKKSYYLCQNVRKKKNPSQFRTPKFIERRQTAVQRLEPDETALRLSPTEQSEYTSFLTLGCQQSWQMQTVRSSCCHSFQMSARIDPHRLPRSDMLNYPPYLGTAVCWQGPRHTRPFCGQLLPSSKKKSFLNHIVINRTWLPRSLHFDWPFSFHLASA